MILGSSGYLYPPSTGWGNIYSPQADHVLLLTITAEGCNKEISRSLPCTETNKCKCIWVCLVHPLCGKRKKA